MGGGTVTELPGPGAPTVAWAPSSDRIAYVPEVPGSTTSLHLYDVAQEQTTPLLELPQGEDGVAGLQAVVWSPDGRWIGFGCCFEMPTRTYTGTVTGELRKVEVATRRQETVGQLSRSVASSDALCWTAGGCTRLT